MFWIDDVHLDATAERAHGKGGQQVGLACSGMPEDADVRVRVAALVEGIDEDRRAGGSVAADEDAGGLLEIRLMPRKEGDKGG